MNQRYLSPTIRGAATAFGTTFVVGVGWMIVSAWATPSTDITPTTPGGSVEVEVEPPTTLVEIPSPTAVAPALPTVIVVIGSHNPVNVSCQARHCRSES